MRILGVDPGTWKTGVGILEAQGNQYRLIHSRVITLTAKKQSIAGRLLAIHQTLVKIIGQFQPQVMALENVFFGKDVSALVKVGEARACAMLAAAAFNLEVIEYPPARVKQAVSGNGRATKDQIQKMIKTLLGLKNLPQADEADALAVAICHGHGGRGREGSGGVSKSSKYYASWKQFVDEHQGKR